MTEECRKPETLVSALREQAKLLWFPHGEVVSPASRRTWQGRAAVLILTYVMARGYRPLWTCTRGETSPADHRYLVGREPRQAAVVDPSSTTVISLRGHACPSADRIASVGTIGR